MTNIELMKENNRREREFQQRQRLKPGTIIRVHRCQHCNAVEAVTMAGTNGGRVTETCKHECSGPMSKTKATAIIREHAPWKLRQQLQSPSPGESAHKLFDSTEDLRYVAIHALRGEYSPPLGWNKEDNKWKES